MKLILISLVTMSMSICVASAETVKKPRLLQLKGDNAPDVKKSAKKPKVLQLEGQNAPDKTFTPMEIVAIPALTSAMRRASTWQEIEAQLFLSYKRVDRLGAGISKKDQDKKQLITRAKNRARLMAKWMIYDLDANGDVSMDELRVFANQPLAANRMSFQPTSEQAAQVLSGLIKQLKVPDLNDNDIFEFSEMLAEAETQAIKSTGNSSARARLMGLIEDYHVFDKNGDGRTVEAEFMAGMRDTFDGFDKDNDQSLDRLEKEQIQTAEREVAAAKRKKR